MLWKSRKISFNVKFKLYNTLVLSILLYGCESWTLVAESELQAFERKCFRRLLGISYKEHKTNDNVYQQIRSLTGQYEPLLTTVKRRKFYWFGHLVRSNKLLLSMTILQGYTDGSRARGRQRKLWVDNLKDWSGESVAHLTSIIAKTRPLWYNQWQTSWHPDDLTVMGSSKYKYHFHMFASINQPF